MKGILPSEMIEIKEGLQEEKKDLRGRIDLSDKNSSEIAQKEKEPRRNFSKRDFQQGEISKQIRCCECNNPGHIKSTCPLLKKYFKRGDPKKKAMMAT